MTWPPTHMRILWGRSTLKVLALNLCASKIQSTPPPPHTHTWACYLSPTSRLPKCGAEYEGPLLMPDQKLFCQPIIDCLQAALMWKSEDNHPPPLAMPRTTSELMDGNLLRHLHHILIHHLPVHNPMLQHAQGSLIDLHI